MNTGISADTPVSAGITGDTGSVEGVEATDVNTGISVKARKADTTTENEGKTDEN